ncbi:hypothetical protein CIHG_01633, partial [Coccidioides immitis H538.4]
RTPVRGAKEITWCPARVEISSKGTTAMKITSKVPSLKLRSRTRAPDCFGPSLLERPGEFADQVKSTIWMWFKILQEQESDVDSAHRSKTQGVLAKYTEVNYSDERSTSV